MALAGFPLINVSASLIGLEAKKLLNKEKAPRKRKLAEMVEALSMTE
jgi:hypothetical protein